MFTFISIRLNIYKINKYFIISIKPFIFDSKKILEFAKKMINPEQAYKMTGFVSQILEFGANFIE